MTQALTIHNCQAVPSASVPIVTVAELRAAVLSAVASGARVAAMFACPAGDAYVRITAVLADDAAGALSVIRADARGAYPSLTPDCPQVHLFEREIFEQCGLRPEGHPWLKPVRFTRPNALPGVTDYFSIEGAEIHEVAVGPVHAGVIEPGHFRFQCHGEHVFTLEISLGYQHRGVEAALAGGPDRRSVHYMETLAGDTTVGHATAYAQALEALADVDAPARAQAIRGIALELERLANHTGDLGALAGDVGYLPTASFCGRIRGDFLNMTALLCGSRFGRGLVRPGGTLFDIDAARASELLDRLEAARRDVTGAANLLWDTNSVLARFEETGRITRETADALGLVGVAARATGAARDTRFDFASGMYRVSHIPVSTWHTGDVFARAYVRWLEIQRSIEFIRNQAAALPAAPAAPVAPVSPHAPSSVPRPVLSGRVPALRPDSLVVSLVEGWRGEICHVAATDGAGRIERYKVVDPSFHNWMGLAMALRDQQISDFPLCNKSFNLSYCGHDL